MTYSPEQIQRISQMNGQRCDHCTQKVQIYEYHFTKALLQVLGLIVGYVETTKVNWFKNSDLPLTKTQYTNFTKLKYWGLIAQSDDALKWCLTKVGMAFYYGHRPINTSVRRFDNHTWEFDPHLIFSDELDPSMRLSETWMKTRHAMPLTLALPL